MRTKLMVMLGILAVLMAGTTAQSQQIIPGVSFPVWSSQTTDVTAGITQLVTFSNRSRPGPVTAFFKSGFLVIPQDRFGVFDDLGLMRMDPMVLGIDTKHLKAIESSVDGRDGGIEVINDGSIVVATGSLVPDLYSVVTSVTQNAGRKDEGGLVPKVLQIFGRKTHRQVTATDTVVAVFGIVDASQYVAMFCHYQLGIAPETMSLEQKYICKSVYFDSRLKGVLEFTTAVGDYSWLSQGLALQQQGFAPPMAVAGPDPALAEYRQQVESMAGQIQLLTEQLAGSQTPTAIPTPRSYEDLQAKYAGQTGVIFVLPDGSPATSKNFWKRTSSGWIACQNQLTVSPGEETTWFYEVDDLASRGWIGFGLSDGDTEPTTQYPLGGLHLLEVR